MPRLFGPHAQRVITQTRSIWIKTTYGSGLGLRWRLTKWLINYSWASALEKACCKLLQDTSSDLETPEEAELGSDTLEQSLLSWLNVVKHETTQLLQCLDKRFLVYFSCVKFCLLWHSFWPYMQHNWIVRTHVQGQSVKSSPEKLMSESKRVCGSLVCGQEVAEKTWRFWSLSASSAA